MSALDKRPFLRADDSRFIRNLKESIIELYNKHNRAQLQGDQRTFFITEGPGGRTGHSVRTPTTVAEITADNGGGSYDAQEVWWSSGWTTWDDGKTFDGTDFPAITEINSVAGLDVGTYVLVWEKVDEDGATSYYFDSPGGSVEALAEGPGIDVTNVAGTHTITSLLESTDSTIDVSLGAAGAAHDISIPTGYSSVPDGTDTGSILTWSGAAWTEETNHIFAASDVDIMKDASGNVSLFVDAASGKTRRFEIIGYNAADTGARTLGVSVGSDGANSVSFDFGNRIVFVEETNRNIGIGGRALENIDIAAGGADNFGIGPFSLFRCEEGTANTALGSLAMQGVSGFTNPKSNTAMGSSALRWIGNGQNNIAIGNSCFTGNSVSSLSGNYNSGIGNAIAIAATSATGNCLEGWYSCRSLTTGSYNNTKGMQSGQNISTGSRNLLWGYKAGDILVGGSDNIIIGHDLDTDAADTNDQFKLGNTTSNAVPLLTGDLANNYLYLKSDSHRLYFGAGDDAYLHWDGSYLDIESAAIKINSAYTIPTADGTANQLLKTDGAGAVTFASLTAGTYIDISGLTINVDLSEVSGYNASNEQVIVNDAGTIEYWDVIDLETALGTISGFGASKALETDGSSNVVWV